MVKKTNSKAATVAESKTEIETAPVKETAAEAPAEKPAKKPAAKKLLLRKQLLKRQRQRQNLRPNAAVPAEKQKLRQLRTTWLVIATTTPSMKKSQSLSPMFRRLLFAEKARHVTRQ